MKQLSVRLPVERYARSPELAPLAILDAALGACEVALFAAHQELAHGALDICPRGSSAMRAHGILVASQRLNVALASYRQALDKDERRARKAQNLSLPF